MKLLDLFCGAGGAAVGYACAGFTEIVGVDIKPQRNYPFEFVQGDALEYLADCGKDFDAIHASPPCQGYSSMRTMWNARKHPLLIEPVRKMLTAFNRPWIIENVMGSRLDGLQLCGLMFGLPIHRHRRFQTSWFFLAPPEPPEHEGVFSIKRHGGNQRTLDKTSKRIRNLGKAAMGVMWMDGREISQAIPPAYTEFIGRQLLAR